MHTPRLGAAACCAAILISSVLAGSSATASTALASGPLSAAPAPAADGLQPEPPPGSAKAAPSIAPKANEPGAGRPLKVTATLSMAQPVPASSLGTVGTLAPPAAAPSTSGWITSADWNIVPAARAATPPMPLFARDVTLAAAPASATLTIAGVGLYHPTVNGRPVSTAVLQPGMSDFAKSVEYRSYDVTGLLGTGLNRLGVELGTGIYNEVNLVDRYSKLTRIGGPLAFTARLDVTMPDGTRRSYDTTSDWWTRSGGTRVSDWYGGEDFDANHHPVGWNEPTAPLSQATGWAPSVVADIDRSIRLHPQGGPAVTARTPVKSVATTRLASGDWVVDFGAYVTGQPRLALAAPAGRVLRMYPAERLAAGVPDQRTATANSTRPIYDQYTAAGKGVEAWQPKFGYHGFRYLRVTGAADLQLAPSMFSAIPVRADLESAGSFRSSSGFLNSLVTMTNKAIDANMQSVPTDCPNREKLGWLEEDHLLFTMLSGRYDLSEYGRNIVRLIVEAQRADGSVPEIAPEIVRFGAPFDNDVHWGGALVQLPWQLYRTYGDTQTLATTYPAMARYITSLQQQAPNHLITFGLGDWISPAPGAQKSITTSMGYYAVVSTMAKAAAALGKAEDAATYTALAGRIKAAINATYYRDKMYGSEQATNAMALVLGITPDAQATRGVIVSLMATWNGHFTMGEIGLSYLFTALHSMGRDDLLWAAITKPTAPSYAPFVDRGAPALPEYWSGMSGNGSLAHFMLGYPAQWAQNGLAGIDQADGSVGYRDLLISPAVFTGPDTVEATRVTSAGTVGVKWVRANGVARVTVTVPQGARAKVVLPSGSHQVTAGTWSFDTGLGTRSSYGAKLFPVPSGMVTRLPWNGALWASVGGVQKQLVYAQWQLTGFRSYVTRLPSGSVVAYAASGPALFAWTPDRKVHQLTYAEWKALGFPTPVRIPRLVTKYQWSPVVWLTTKWRPESSTWTVVKLTYSEWGAMGYPRPADNVVTHRSRIFRKAASPAIYLTDPGGVTHQLTYAEWRHLGYPAYSVVL